MPKPSEIIKWIRDDADELQYKLSQLLKPENSNDYTEEQMRAAFRADNSLRGFRGFDLGELEKAFENS